jgi:hypothetical protein
MGQTLVTQMTQKKLLQQQQPEVSPGEPRTHPDVKSRVFHPSQTLRKSKIGFQLYATLEENEMASKPEAALWEQYRVTFHLDHHGIHRIFSTITDHLWPSDRVTLYRVALDCAINPSPVPLCIIFKGLLQAPREDEGAAAASAMHGRGGGGEDMGLVVPIAALANPMTSASVPLFERASNKECGSCHFDSLDLEVSWSSQPTAQQMLTQWMLDEEKSIMCISVVLDMVYNVETIKM